MRWQLIVLTAFLTLAATQVAQAQDDAQKQWCEAACRVAPSNAPPPGCDCSTIGDVEPAPVDPPPQTAPAPPVQSPPVPQTAPAEAGVPDCEVACQVNPFTAPAQCNCNATITTGSGGPAPGSGAGEQTTGDIIDEMIATYEAEIAQVQNYLLIEKSKASPRPDIRYYERKSSSPGNTGSGGGEDPFVWIPNQELGRRELAANPSHGSGNSRTEIPSEVANDPTLFVNALGDALEILGQFAGDAKLGAALGEVADQEAKKIRGDAQESRDGIEGADTLGGLLSEDLLLAFTHPDTDVRFGAFMMNADDGRPYVPLPRGTVQERITASALSMESYASGDGPYQDIAEVKFDPTYSAPCAIFSLPRVDFGVEGLPKGSTIESGELWLCRIEGQNRPVRLSLEYLQPTAGQFVRRFVQKENQDFVRVGPVLTPRRIKNRISDGTDVFVDELERVIKINEGLLTQFRLAELRWGVDGLEHVLSGTGRTVSWATSSMYGGGVPDASPFDQ